MKRLDPLIFIIIEDFALDPHGIVFLPAEPTRQHEEWPGGVRGADVGGLELQVLRDDRPGRGVRGGGDHPVGALKGDQVLQRLWKKYR